MIEIKSAATKRTRSRKASVTPAEAKTIRERIGVTTELIAARIGVTKGRVWEYESPTRTRPLPERAGAVLLKLADTFDDAVQAAAREAGKTGVVPRHTDIADFEVWQPKLAGWGVGAQAAFVAAVAQAAGATVEYQ